MHQRAAWEGRLGIAAGFTIAGKGEAVLALLGFVLSAAAVRSAIFLRLKSRTIFAT
jgi:hypothetical protein